MSIKSILCIFEGSKGEFNAVNAAFILAATFDAQVRFLHISHEPTAYANLYDEGIFISQEMVSYIEEINKKMLDKAKNHITSLSTNHNIPLDKKQNPLHHAHAQFLHKIGNVDATIAKEGRASDIIIIGRGIEPDILYDDALMAAIFSSGRQVLLLPTEHNHEHSQWKDKVISLAWDGSMEASRAIFNSLPLLKRAETIYMLIARDHAGISDVNFTNEIANYLSAHGINTNYINIDCEKHSAGEAILLKAKELKTELIVMGAYGHSHLREMIMGGFTKYMLEKSDIPLLLSH